MAFPTGWAYRIPITIDHTLVDSDLTDFTFLLDKSFDAVLTQDNGPLDLDGTRPSLSGGGDLRFSSDEAGTNRLAMDVRQWEPANDPTSSPCGCDVAVLIPSVSSTADTTIYLWWGKSGETQPAVTDTYGQYDAYASHVSGWWSMEDGVSPNDRTSNQNHGINATGGTDADGKVGIGRSYDGSGKVDLTNPITNAAPFSLSFAYYKRSQGGGNYGSIFGGDGYGDGFRHLSSDELNVRVGGNVASSTPALSNNTWHFVTFQNDGSGWTSTANLVTGSGSGTGSFSIEHLIGIAGASDRSFDGIVDEIHFHTIAVGSAWEKAQYYNMMDPSSILTFGSITDISADDNLTASEISSNSSVDTSILGQEHSLSGVEISSGSSTDTTTIGQEHDLYANEIENTSGTDGSTIGQTHDIATGSIESTAIAGAPELEIAAVDLIANGVAAATELDVPEFRQAHVMEGGKIQSSMETSSSDFQQVHKFGANEIEIMPAVGAPYVIMGNIREIVTFYLEFQDTEHLDVLFRDLAFSNVLFQDSTQSNVLFQDIEHSDVFYHDREVVGVTFFE